MIHYRALLSLVFLLSLNGYAAPLSISSLDWSVSANPSVLEIGFDKSSVARFIETLTDNDYLEAQIGDFKWVDLDGDKVYELVASVDYSGRAFFNNLYVIKQRGSKYYRQEVSVHNLETLDGAIADLDGDGTSELILPILLSDYNGARPMAVWAAVYKWNGDKFIDASGQFRAFYDRRVLPELEKRIRKWSELVPPDATPEWREMREEELSAAWMVRDKIARVTGENPQAGVERAKVWSKSSNRYLRENAVTVFADIREKYFKPDLQLLAVDPDPGVALSAKLALERLEKKEPL